MGFFFSLIEILYTFYHGTKKKNFISYFNLNFMV